MPAAIELLANEEARKWYGYCVGLKIESDIQKELINRALTHIAASSAKKKCAAKIIYLWLRHFYTACALIKIANLLKLPDLTYQLLKIRLKMRLRKNSS